MTETPSQAYERIDAIRSILAMRQALEHLGPALRQETILLGVARSRHQFTWSHFAQQFKVPKAKVVAALSALRVHMFVAGHLYEVILDAAGQWRGLLHVVDAEQIHDPMNSDVVITGARYDFETGTAELGDADVREGTDAKTLLPLAATAVRRAIGLAAAEVAHWTVGRG